MKTYVHLCCLAEIFLQRDMFQTKVVEIIKTHILYSITSPKKHSIHEIILKNMVKPDRPQMQRTTDAICMPNN
jgi:hypothetical protein